MTRAVALFLLAGCGGQAFNRPMDAQILTALEGVRSELGRVNGRQTNLEATVAQQSANQSKIVDELRKTAEASDRSAAVMGTVKEVLERWLLIGPK